MKRPQLLTFQYWSLDFSGCGLWFKTIKKTERLRNTCTLYSSMYVTIVLKWINKQYIGLMQKKPTLVKVDLCIFPNENMILRFILYFIFIIYIKKECYLMWLNNSSHSNGWIKQKHCQRVITLFVPKIHGKYSNLLRICKILEHFASK